VTLLVTHLFARLPPSLPLPLLPTLAVAGVYGIMANVCFTGGWIAELLFRRHDYGEFNAVGPTLFRYGFAFSIGLTLFPIGMMAMFKALRILSWLFQGQG
jgi:hypothetical protein